MERTEITKRIKELVRNRFFDTNLDDRLTDLFIELSDSRCREQKHLCAIHAKRGITPHIAALNAPLPEIV